MSSAAPSQIVMPKLGLTMSEGLIAEWRVQAGDEVSPGQILFVVETDKIANEIEAPAPGRIIELLADVGATMPVGGAVALWTGPNQAPGSDERTGIAPAPKPAAPPSSGAIAGKERILSTPVARRLAAQLGVNLQRVAGSGPRGRIQARDVEGAHQRRATSLEPAPRAPVNLRRLIAERVSRSKAEIPHFYVSAEARFDALADLRAQLNGADRAPKISVTAVLLAAVAAGLRAVPAANVLWREEAAIALDGANVGVTVDTPGGVMSPVICNVGALDLNEIALALESAVSRAREGRLRSGDVAPAAASLSNVGMHKVRSLTPIIDLEQTYMIGVGAPHDVFRPDANGAPKACKIVELTMACDHRAVDGVLGAKFLSAIVDLIENPLRLLLRDR